jgi:Na+/H+ antiporter NhaD/arsenite permease-like protein
MEVSSETGIFPAGDAVTPGQLIAFTVFVVCFALILYRKFKILYISLAAAAILVILGIVTPLQVVLQAINWNVLGIYFGFGMLSIAFGESQVPKYIAFEIMRRVKTERWAIFWLAALAAALSSVMPNPVVVMMLAPIAIEIADRFRSSLFNYLVPLAISANVVTTVSMVADPPATILAMETGMRFFDFYWFQGRIGLGLISLVGVVAALLSLLLIYRKMDKGVAFTPEPLEYTYSASILFLAGVLALAFIPISPGVISLVVGVVALLICPMSKATIFREFDWESFLFIIGIFIVVAAIEITGLLAAFSAWFVSLGITSPTLILAFLVWVSVLLSAFIDNVPYTILMIPVCTQIAGALGVNPFPFLFGMLIGTGIGGNITPVGATANVIACGMLEKRGYTIDLWEYMKISVPFSIIAVAVAHLLLQLIWL